MPMTRLKISDLPQEIRSKFGLESYSKYGNQRETIDGITFDSRKEANRYCVLKMMEQSGYISDLKCHVPYSLDVNGVHITKYEADFVYQEGPETVVEDVKGKRTREYLMKRKLMLACHGIRIKET